MLGAANANVWIRNYMQHRGKTDALARNWKRRAAGAADTQRRDAHQTALCEQVRGELSELQLIAAAMLRLLRSQSIIPKPTTETDPMTETANIFDRYLTDHTRRMDFAGAGSSADLDVAPEQGMQLLTDVAELRLVVASMLRMLVDRSVVSAEQLQAIAVEIDALDGQVDGKLDGKRRRRHGGRQSSPAQERHRANRRRRGRTQRRRLTTFTSPTAVNPV